MKIRYLIPLFFLGTLFAQNSRYDSIALGPKGPVPFATVAICTQPANTSTQPCSPLANLCSSLSDATCNQPNPVTADSLGNYHAYIKQAQAPFTVQIYGPQVASPFVLSDQSIGAGLGTSNVFTSSNTFSNAGVFTNTQMNENTLTVLNGCSPLTEFQAIQGGSNFATDALTGCIKVPNTSTVFGGYAVAGYASTASTTTGITSGKFYSRCLANGTECFGLNPVVQDIGGLTTNVKLIGQETDTQPQNGPSAYSFLVGHQSVLFAASAGTYGNAFSAAQGLGTLGQWGTGYLCAAGAVANACLDTGAKGTATNVSGNFNSNPLVITSSFWTGAAQASDQFSLATIIGAGSPPSFVNLNLTHPAGVASANFLIDKAITFGLLNGSSNATLIAPNSSAPNNTTITLPAVAGTIPVTIASGTATMTTAAIAAGNCGTTVTVAATGVATTDAITWAFNAAPAGTNAGLVAWPTANNVNFAYCSNTAETPAAATINWRVVR